MSKVKLAIAYVCLVITVLVAMVGCRSNEPVYKSVDYSDFFQGIEGCFIMLSEESGDFTVYNKEMTQERYSPMSTFKIPHSLIGLEEGILTDGDHVYKWDGVKRYFDYWNKDHNLKSAMANSVVWYYERLASEIGEETMQTHLDNMSYGNNDISGGLTKFWLDSSIKISPEEQVLFMKQLYNAEIPYSERSLDIVKEIIIRDKSDHMIFSGKTGTAAYGTLGWFVGALEKDNKRYYFATLLIGEEVATGAKAQEISKDILVDMHLYSY